MYDLLQYYFMAVALNEGKNLPTVEDVEERLLVARNIQVPVFGSIPHSAQNESLHSIGVLMIARSTLACTLMRYAQWPPAPASPSYIRVCTVLLWCDTVQENQNTPASTINGGGGGTGARAHRRATLLEDEPCFICNIHTEKSRGWRVAICLMVKILDDEETRGAPSLQCQFLGLSPSFRSLRPMSWSSAQEQKFDGVGLRATDNPSQCSLPSGHQRQLTPAPLHLPACIILSRIREFHDRIRLTDVWQTLKKRMTRLSCQHITTSPGTTRADCEEPIKVTTLGARNLRAISRRHLPPSSGGIVTFGGDDNEKSGRLHTGSQPRNPVPDQNTSPAMGVYPFQVPAPNHVMDRALAATKGALEKKSERVSSFVFRITLCMEPCPGTRTGRAPLGAIFYQTQIAHEFISPLAGFKFPFPSIFSRAILSPSLPVLLPDVEIEVQRGIEARASVGDIL
ncbi:hypothetical protein EV421DRAFT_1747013 [Armillaria borealis]|uniref:Uncharacterized protein n=1 Tax=Armillaria borealis TaxID=47425 RepID=A0AA39IDG3_9AGAR|nr:hypothetical protein EV421DRAFT_1747013 [Armillaria borealis]